MLGGHLAGDTLGLAGDTLGLAAHLCLSCFSFPFPGASPDQTDKVGQGGLPEPAGIGLGSPVGGGPMAEGLAVCARLCPHSARWGSASLNRALGESGRGERRREGWAVALSGEGTVRPEGVQLRAASWQ